MRGEDISGVGVLGIDEESLDSYLEDAEGDSLDSCMESLETTASDESTTTSSDSTDSDEGEVQKGRLLGAVRFAKAASESFKDPLLRAKKKQAPLAGKLKRAALEFDDDRQRYAALIAEAECVVHEIKSALYEADFYGQAQGKGADHLLEDATAMLNPLINQTLTEAAKLQGRAERGVQSRQSLAVRLYEHKGSLQELLDLRVQQARADNARNRVECDKTWIKIRGDEDELAELRKKQESAKLETKGAAAGNSPSGGGGDAADAAAAGGGGAPLTLEGAHALLHAFASVLRPHLEDVIPEDVNQRSPAQAVTLEFLTAASGLQAGPNAMAALNRSASARDASLTPALNEISLIHSASAPPTPRGGSRGLRADQANLGDPDLPWFANEYMLQAVDRQNKSVPSSPGSPGSERRLASNWQIHSSPASPTTSRQGEMADQIRLLKEVGESF